MQSVVVYTPLEAAIYNSGYGVPIAGACIAFLVAFLVSYKIAELVGPRGMNFHRGASQIATAISFVVAAVAAIAAFKFLVI